MALGMLAWSLRFCPKALARPKTFGIVIVNLIAVSFALLMRY